VPLIAVPTTAGTGTEATKNAVLSRLGPGGFKKSLRHDSLVPDAAVVDPLLTIDCPRELTAACGMDAFTQLLESYVSTGSSPVTDALALSGMSAVGDSLLAAWESGSDVEARGGMSYAALMSGIALANAGLGVVHGIAAVVGGLFEAPHGAVCGTLVGEATRFNIDALRRSGKAGSAALEKYGSAGSVLSGCPAVEVDACCDSLLDLIDGWVERLRLPLLGEYGVTPRDAEHIAAQAEIKSNPAPLGLSEVRDILLKRI
jgi:alcohol dehydrogenase class IV